MAQLASATSALAVGAIERLVGGFAMMSSGGFGVRTSGGLNANTQPSHGRVAVRHAAVLGFCGVVMEQSTPDESTILRFRHLLEARKLC